MAEGASRVLFCVLSERTSAKGGPYMSGWLGKTKLLAFPGKEPDKFNNPTWDLYIVENEPRGGDSRAKREPQVGMDLPPEPPPF